MTNTTATTATTEAAPRAAVAAVAALCACSPALAERWQVEPQISLAAIYSDNIHLLPPGASPAPGDSKDDFVGQFAPSIAIRRDTERLDVDFSYLYQYLGYAEDSDNNGSFNQADAHVAAELVREHLFVDLDGGISQQLIDPEQAFAPSNIPLTSNRIDAVDATLAPYWTQSIGNVGDLELRYEHGIVRYEDAPPVTVAPGEAFPVQDLDRQQAFVTLVSPLERRGVTWGANYEFDHQEFSTASDVEFEEASLQLGYWVTGSARLYVVGGMESDYQEHRSDAELDEAFWDVGMVYSVAERDDVEIRIGERVFGPSRYVRWQHTLTGSTLRLDYIDEASTNSEALFASRTQPVDVESEAGLNRPETTDIFVRHRLQGTWTLDRGGRSVWDLAVYGERRDDRIRDPDDPTPVLGTEENFGTTADWKWKAGGHTTLGFGLGWERSDLTGDDDFDLWHASVEASHDLGIHTALRLLVERASRDGSEFSDYDENRVSLFVDRKFFPATLMYRSFYGFTGKPFQLTPDLRFLYPSSSHKRAMAYLRYGLEQGEGFVVITGDIGTGKTLLIQTLLAELSDQTIATARIAAANLEAERVPAAVSAALGQPFEGKSKELLLRNLEKSLLHARDYLKGVLLIVDEAQTLSQASLEELRILSNLEANGRALLQIFLVGQTELQDTLRGSRMRQLRQRIVVSHHLDPLSIEETKRYIGFRLVAVGWNGTPSFTPDVYEHIQARTRGVPRKINLLMDRLLVYGFLEEIRAFEASHVEAVLKEMGAELSGDIESVATAAASASTDDATSTVESTARPRAPARAEDALPTIAHSAPAEAVADAAAPAQADEHVTTLESRLRRLEAKLEKLAAGPARPRR